MATDRKEQDRLAALDRYDILDTPPEEAFDRITRLARKVLQVPVAAITLIDGHRQWFKSGPGLRLSETTKDIAFCSRVVEDGQPLIVPDAAHDPRFATNPLVAGEPHIRSYAGFPLKTRKDVSIGTLCAMDTEPREFTPDQIELLGEFAAMAMDEIELRLLARRDALTGTLSRRAFKDEARRILALALRHRHPLSCIIFDLDHFKSINDRYGHGIGDLVLKNVAEASEAQLRQSDLLGRIGGEEFAVFLPETDRRGAMAAAEKLRTAIAALRIDSGAVAIGVTASFGVASLGAETRDQDTLLSNAEEALHAAKLAGRDRCMEWKSREGAARGPQRRRVLKGGQILYNGRTAILDCTVRSLSEDGAGLAVFSSQGVPRRFDLVIKSDKFDRPCRVVFQTERHIDVEFC